MLLDPCKASPCLPILNAIYRFGGTPASQQIIFFLFIKNGKQNLAQLYLQFGALDMALWPSEQIFIKKLVLENGILLAHQFLYSLLHSQINWLSSGPDSQQRNNVKAKQLGLDQPTGSCQLFYCLPSSGICSCVRTIDMVMCIQNLAQPCYVALGRVLDSGLILIMNAF